MSTYVACEKFECSDRVGPARDLRVCQKIFSFCETHNLTNTMIPAEVQDLLNDLAPNPDKVGTIESSKMIVTVNKRTFELGAKDCEKILQSPESVKALAEVLGGDDIGVELHAVDLTDNIMEALERSCDSVDEI